MLLYPFAFLYLMYLLHMIDGVASKVKGAQLSQELKTFWFPQWIMGCKLLLLCYVKIYQSQLSIKFKIHLQTSLWILPLYISVKLYSWSFTSMWPASYHWRDWQVDPKTRVWGRRRGDPHMRTGVLAFNSNPSKDHLQRGRRVDTVRPGMHPWVYRVVGPSLCYILTT